MGNFKAEAASLTFLYGDTPTFFGQPHVPAGELAPGQADVAVSGVPWEGTVTWGSWSGCELATRTIRQASVRYTGFLPEYGVDAFSTVRLVDLGDVAVDMGDREFTFARVEERVESVVRAGALPVTLGGDHSIAFPIVRALTRALPGPLGIVHLDAHYDNKDEYDGDPYARCCPFRRIAELPGVRTTSMVHLGIRGPRNTPAQWAYARSIGATTLSIRDVRALGIDAAVAEAHRVASEGTAGVYVSVCSDVLEAAFNPGGPVDPDGLTPHELFRALHLLGQEANVVGFDIVEVYPPQDPNGVSSHTAAWAVLHLLVGMAMSGRFRRA